MKLYHDNEYNILKDVHELRRSDCLILSDKENTASFLDTAQIIDDILDDNGLLKWEDNSKSATPPDLLNKSDSLIMEVMRIDDHSPDGKRNPVLAKQRKISRENELLINSLPKNANFFINAVTDLPTDEDHNYKFYYSSFQRTLRKHLSKLPTYKNNYHNCKTIFLVFDETSGVYFEKIISQNNSIIGRLHFPFFDNRFLNEFIDSDLDYLIWYIPYNHYKTIGDHLELPHLIIFDIKHIKNGIMLQRLDYDEDKMVSNEK